MDIDENDDMEDFGADFSDEEGDDDEGDSEEGSSSGEHESMPPGSVNAHSTEPKCSNRTHNCKSKNGNDCGGGVCHCHQVCKP